MASCLAKGRAAVVGVLLFATVAAAGCARESSSSSSSVTGAAAVADSASSMRNRVMASTYPGCAEHLNDGDNARSIEMTDLRGVVYGEISLLCGQDGASMYNTTGLNDEATPDDSAPASVWNSISEDTVAREYRVPGAFKSGPRFWVNDWMNLPVGRELSFNGLKARWFAYPDYPPDVRRRGITAHAYHGNDIWRDSVMGFSSGTSVYVLVDPNNTPWVMQAASRQVNPDTTLQSLGTLGSRLSLPSGWQYKVIQLNKDLIIQAVNGTAKVTTDDQGNTYDMCFDTACSHNPLTGQ